MSDTPPAVAPVKGSVVAYLSVDGAVRAVEFYKKAFGAELAGMQPPDEKGRTMHAHLYIKGSSLMLSDFYPEHGHPKLEPQGFSVLILTQNIDADYQRAIEAGAAAIMPPADMFWGDRYGQLKDPFGVTWAMNQGKR
jgi:PhnB protein